MDRVVDRQGLATFVAGLSVGAATYYFLFGGALAQADVALRAASDEVARLTTCVDTLRRQGFEKDDHIAALRAELEQARRAKNSLSTSWGASETDDSSQTQQRLQLKPQRVEQDGKQRGRDEDGEEADSSSSSSEEEVDMDDFITPVQRGGPTQHVRGSKRSNAKRPARRRILPVVPLYDASNIQ